MPTLKKATLQEITADAAATPLGPEIEVQFNPATLKLDLANQVEGGDSRGRQNRQYLGKTSTTLTFDLHFDTADQGDTDAPVSVRTLTAQVERFVLPKGEGNTKQAPPKCRFHWDELVVDGIISSVSIDFDLFAANGTPLRAKMSVSIKEQDAKYELLQSGPGANQAGNATPPGAPGTGPGSTGSPAPPIAAPTPFRASRWRTSPRGWVSIPRRGAASRRPQPGRVELAVAVGRRCRSTSARRCRRARASASRRALQAGASVSVDASFGLDTSAGAGRLAPASRCRPPAASAPPSNRPRSSSHKAPRRARGDRSARQCLLRRRPRAVTASAGATAIGVASIGGGASIGAAAAVPALATIPPPSGAPKPSMPDQPRTPLQMTGLPSPSTQAAAPPAPAPPMADPRAVSFGSGVPLRPRVGSAADLRASAAAGRVPLRPRSPVAAALSSNDPSAPPWTQLPSGAVRRTADAADAIRNPPRPCGCGPRSQGGR